MKSSKLGTLILLSSIFISSILSCKSNIPVDNRPNIIFIMVDDIGYSDLSSYRRTDYQTPILDAFIDEGVKFTQAYAAAAVCTPSRVGLMTGRYPARIKIGLHEPLRGEIDGIVGLTSETPTLSSMIKKSGYETALFGKWHLGIAPEFLPHKHGFDQFFGIIAGGADYIDHKSWFIKKPILYEYDRPVDKSGYLTDLITDYTIDFINKKHNQPFFISLQYTAPHWPYQLPGDKPLPDGVNPITGGTPEIFAGMVKNLDNNIGRVLKALEETDLKASTLVIFTGDQGGGEFSDMGPLKGGKSLLWEGGIRVPAAVRWPGIIKPNTTSEQVVINMDWTVTMLDVAQAITSENIAFDGLSLLSHFKDNSSTTPRKLYWRSSNWELQDAYRSNNWKYLKNDEGEFLFDLENDIGEATNLKDIYPEKFNQLKREFQELDGQMLDRIILNE